MLLRQHLLETPLQLRLASLFGHSGCACFTLCLPRSHWSGSFFLFCFVFLFWMPKSVTELFLLQSF